MTSWTDGVLSIILDRSVEQLIGAIVLALILSAAAAVVGVWVLRSRRDETTRLTVVMLVLCLVTMVLTGAFVQHEYDPRASETTREPGMRPPGELSPFSRMAWLLDADGDGDVSRDEVRHAAEVLGVEDRLPRGPGHFPGRDGSHRDESGPAAETDDRPGEPEAARELHDLPAEEGAGPPASVPVGPPVESTEEHP